MQRLIYALQVIQEECRKVKRCSDCPLFEGCYDDVAPCDWEIDKLQEKFHNTNYNP